MFTFLTTFAFVVQFFLQFSRFTKAREFQIDTKNQACFLKQAFEFVAKNVILLPKNPKLRSYQAITIHFLNISLKMKT